MNQNSIVTNRSKLKKTKTLNQESPVKGEMANELADKAKKSFERLYRVLSYKKISLKRTFEAYDKEGHGNLTFDCFKNMISRLDPTFTEDDVLSLFDYIDTDHSKTI